MHGILVDSNILLDIFLDNPDWADWSVARLNRFAQTFPLYINPVIYSEISLGFESIEVLENILKEMDIRILQIPKEALFLSGEVYLKYRKGRGIKHSPMPDFYIGAQAAVNELSLLTRDSKNYRFYFPTVRIISP